MMKTNDENYDELKSDVKIYLESNRESAQCVTDVIGAMKDKSVNFEINDNINIDDLYADLSRSQRTAQLILNLYTDSETYRSCLIDQSFDMKSEDLISKFYEKESRTETPEQSDVVDAIYNYVLCYLRVQYYEVCELIKKNNMKFKDIICPMCDTAFCDDNVLCPLCSYSIVEAMKDVLKSQKKVKINKNLDQKMSEHDHCEPVSYQDLSICKQCKKHTTIIGEEMCGDCFNARWSDWICPYEFCGKSNNSNAEYCELCGIERSQTSITRAPLWRKQNGNLDQIWVCEKCKIINEVDKFKHCQVCDIPMDKSSETIANQEESKRAEEMTNSRNSNHKVNNQSNIYQENKRDSMICGQCNNVKMIFDEEMCKDCFNARVIDWICPYKSCKSTNTKSDQYCKSCGIKRSPVLIVDTPIERWKNARLIKVWICGKCHHHNENIENKICTYCFTTMNKSSQETENHSKNDREFVLLENKNTMEYQENNQSNIDQKKQWKCEGCELINDVAFLSCRRCNWARTIIWTCSRCSKENEESVQQCGACGRTNENAEKKFCVRCRQKESIMNELCAQCLSDRDLDWQCLYRNCGRRNSSKDNYCRECGLHRYIVLEHGAPNWRFKYSYPERIWICFYCWTINKWSDERCTKYYVCCLAERDKFAKWCKSCWSQNGRSEIKCSRCKQWL